MGKHMSNKMRRKLLALPHHQGSDGGDRIRRDDLLRLIDAKSTKKQKRCDGPRG